MRWWIDKGDPDPLFFAPIVFPSAKRRWSACFLSLLIDTPPSGPADIDIDIVSESASSSFTTLTVVGIPSIIRVSIVG